MAAFTLILMWILVGFSALVGIAALATLLPFFAFDAAFWLQHKMRPPVRNGRR